MRSFAFAVVLCLGCAAAPTAHLLILRPSSEFRATPDPYGYPYEEVVLPIKDGRQVSLWHVHADDPRGVVLVMPGADQNKGRYVVGIPIFLPAGYDLILPDYEGFGESPGEPRFDYLVDDALILADYAAAQHENVAIFGISFGAPLAVYAAAKRDLDGLVLEGTPILAEEARLWLIDHDLPFPPLWIAANLYFLPQLPDAYDILKYVRDVHEPKLFLHSTEDEIVPFAAGKKVFDAAPEPKTFWEMRGKHAKMVEIEPELYRRTIVDWLAANVENAE